MKLRRTWRRRTVGAGLLYSVALHAVVIAILIFWPRPAREPPPRIATMLVDLVPSGGAGDAGVAEAKPTPQPSATATPHSRRPMEKADDMVAALLRMAQAAHGAAQGSSGGHGQSGAGSGARGPGSTTLKDFIRAQIERRWQIDAGAPDMVVTLRLVLDADGAVLSAVVVEDPGLDLGKRSVAMAARNAALLSSPLQFPPGLDGAGEMTVELNTRDTRR